MGVMQLMPGTYSQMAEQYRLGDDAFDPHDSIYAGAAYLNWLHHKYGYPAMFAAYNDGPGNIEDHLYHGRPLPAETRGYIASIARFLKEKTIGLGKVALTQPDGVKVKIDPAKVTAIQAAQPGIYARECPCGDQPGQNSPRRARECGRGDRAVARSRRGDLNDPIAAPPACAAKRRPCRSNERPRRRTAR